MRRRLLAASAPVLAALALGGCSHVHVPYLPGDGPFVVPGDADIGNDRRVDPVQTANPVKVGARPPCKFGGERCPPWERAWPTNPGVSPADKVTAAGEVIPAKPSAR